MITLSTLGGQFWPVRACACVWRGCVWQSGGKDIVVVVFNHKLMLRGCYIHITNL